MCRIVHQFTAFTQFGKFARDLVSLDGVPRIELIVGRVGREVVCPEDSGVSLSVGEDVEFVAYLHPQAVRIVFGIKSAEPAVSAFFGIDFFPVVRRIRYEIGHSRFVYVKIDRRTVVGDVIAHDLCGAVRQYFDTAHFTTDIIGYGHLLRGSKVAVSIEECEEANRFLSEALDREDFIARSYNLEVCSPGLDRELIKDADYERFAGRPVEVKTYEKICGSREHEGILAGKKDGIVTIETDGGKLDIPADKISRINLAVVF